MIIGFDSVDYTVNEGDGTATLNVRVLSGVLDTEVVVRFNTVNGTANCKKNIKHKACAYNYVYVYAVLYINITYYNGASDNGVSDKGPSL